MPNRNSSPTYRWATPFTRLRKENSFGEYVKTNLHQVLNVIYDVTAVSFDTWIYSLYMGFIIKYHHDGDIRIGNVKNIIK